MMNIYIVCTTNLIIKDWFMTFPDLVEAISKLQEIMMYADYADRMDLWTKKTCD